jgi:hypothetical protein
MDAPAGSGRPSFFRGVVLALVVAGCAVTPQVSLAPDERNTAIQAAFTEASYVSTTLPVVTDVIKGRAVDVCPLDMCGDLGREVIVVVFDITMQGDPAVQEGVLKVVLDTATGSTLGTEFCRAEVVGCR